MKSYTHCLSLDSLLAAAESQPVQNLLSCQPLNLKQLDVEALVLHDGQNLPTSTSDNDQFYILLSGGAQVSCAEPQEADQSQVITELGTTVYQPANSPLQLAGHGAAPIVFLRVNLHGKQNRPNSTSPDAAIQIPSALEIKPFYPGEERGTIVDAPTPSLRRLYSFLLMQTPGAVVPVHQHRDHGALLMFLEGEIEMQGQTFAAPALLYYRGGEPHGFRCADSGPVKAVVIEFYQEPPLLENLRSSLRGSSIGAIGRSMKAKLS